MLFEDAINTLITTHSTNKAFPTDDKFWSDKIDDAQCRSVHHISQMGMFAEEVSNFYYDKLTGLFFCDIPCGYHFRYATYIAKLRGVNIDCCDAEDYMVTNDLAMVLSSVGYDEVMVSKDAILTAQEKLIFKKMGLTQRRF